MLTFRTLLPAVSLALSVATAAEASDRGYLGDGQPWIVGAGMIVLRASDRTEVAGSVRVGRRGPPARGRCERLLRARRADARLPAVLDRGLPEVEGRFASGTSALAVGASLRVAIRF